MFFHVASLLSTRVDNEKVGVDDGKALELTNSTDHGDSALTFPWLRIALMINYNATSSIVSLKIDEKLEAKLSRRIIMHTTVISCNCCCCHNGC